MRLISLQSGSNGNCVYVEAGKQHLLFDAGISGKSAVSRLAGHGRDIRNVDSVFISHDHRDHVISLGIFQRKFSLPAVVSGRTLDAAQRRCDLGRLGHVRTFDPGEDVRVGDITVETIPTAHDATDGCGFVIDDGSKRLGILTDLGHTSEGLFDVICTLDAVLLESNYDDALLQNGPYPEALKQRISGPGGHISNTEAADLIARAHTESGRLQWACLGHLSAENNTPSRALRVATDAVAGKIPIHLASRHQASDVLEIE
jgi:phosphoribosyl 1,2-cyclic phosphodiesterase